MTASVENAQVELESARLALLRLLAHTGHPTAYRREYNVVQVALERLDRIVRGLNHWKCDRVGGCRGDAGCDRCQGTGLHPIARDLLGEERVS